MRRQPFEAVVDRYGPTVPRVCRAVLGPASAEDARSETFPSARRPSAGCTKKTLLALEAAVA
jgi:DNA-directed RNA polymerase specialized sigma24 family protein